MRTNKLLAIPFSEKKLKITSVAAKIGLMIFLPYKFTAIMQ